MVKKIVVHSAEEVEQLVKEGYAIVSEAHFTSGEGVAYTLEKGSDWSLTVGSK